MDGEVRAGGWSLPGYRIGPVLGRGGFATVYRAHQVSLDRDVAIKVLTADLSTDGDRLRFDRERRALARLSPHPHVVDVHDAGITPERRPYLVMRLYPGGTLADRLARQGRLPVAESIDVVTKLASALDAAHAIGMLHRDVKPQNVLLTETGEPVLADFGIAGILEPEHDSAQTSTAFFTLAHVAPEILEHRRYSVASDVYALASTTYQLLTGRSAFDPDDPRIGTHVLDSPPPPITLRDVPAAVADAVLAGMAKNPTDRPATAGTFADTLAGLASAAPSAQVPPATTSPHPQPVPGTMPSVPPTAPDIPPTAPDIPPTAPDIPPTAPGIPATAPNVPLPATVPEDPPEATLSRECLDETVRRGAVPGAPPTGNGTSGPQTVGRRPVPARVLPWAAALTAAVTVLVVIGGGGYYLLARRSAGGPGAIGTVSPTPGTNRATPSTPASGTSPASTSPASTSPASTSPAIVSAASSPGTTQVATPTCEQPGELRRLTGVRATAAAKPDETYAGVGHFSYGAENLVDGDTSTAWVEGSAGLGIGTRIRVTFPRAVDVRLGCIVDGYGKSWDVYRRNARVRDLEVVTDGGSTSTVLADSGSADRPAVFQPFRIPPGRVDHLDLVVGSAYAAERISGKPAYDDTCISELEFWYAAG